MRRVGDLEPSARGVGWGWAVRHQVTILDDGGIAAIALSLTRYPSNVDLQAWGMYALGWCATGAVERARARSLTS